MSAFGFEALSVLLVLLPGFVAARIIQSLIVRPSQTELDKIVEALLYSFLIYVAFIGIFDRFPLRILEEASAGGLKIYAPLVQRNDLLTLLGLGVAIGLLVSFSNTLDLHASFLRKFRFTQRTTRSSIWSDAFHDFSCYVQVEFMDGRKLIGWPRYFSDTPEEASLFLEKVGWVNSDGTVTDIDGPGVLITKNLQIESITFLRGQRLTMVKQTRWTRIRNAVVELWNSILNLFRPTT